MPERKFCRTCKGTKQKLSGAIRLKEKGRNTMNNPTRQTNRSFTRGAKFALLALLTGIAVTSIIGRANDKHHDDKHHDDKHHDEKHHGDKQHDEKHHGDKQHGIVYRWDLI